MVETMKSMSLRVSKIEAKRISWGMKLVNFGITVMGDKGKSIINCLSKERSLIQLDSQRETNQFLLKDSSRSGDIYFLFDRTVFNHHPKELALYIQLKHRKTGAIGAELQLGDIYGFISLFGAVSQLSKKADSFIDGDFEVIDLRDNLEIETHWHATNYTFFDKKYGKIAEMFLDLV
ncbi:TPA: hypothetical protein I7551_16420 [Vibrio cholerae]|uniref:Uncharacterized protein n=2 Tax=Vibrio cholerae TaxID=666 RepID=A0ABD7STD7_VIBCL|nr:hypothetical protein FXF03_00945 [Vibrio cholerae]GIA99796.1 hypothetical protein VCSRO136_2431 [Vibrio cholerae]HAS7809501.1 hypothetical protein [Vibrio cholerae]